MIRGNGFTEISCFICVSTKTDDHIYANFPVFLEWIIWVIEGLQRLYLTEVWNKENNGIPCIGSC